MQDRNIARDQNQNKGRNWPLIIAGGLAIIFGILFLNAQFAHIGGAGTQAVPGHDQGDLDKIKNLEGQLSKVQTGSATGHNASDLKQINDLNQKLSDAQNNSGTDHNGTDLKTIEKLRSQIKDLEASSGTASLDGVSNTVYSLSDFKDWTSGKLSITTNANSIKVFDSETDADSFITALWNKHQPKSWNIDNLAIIFANQYGDQDPVWSIFFTGNNMYVITKKDGSVGAQVWAPNNNGELQKVNSKVSVQGMDKLVKSNV